MKPARLSHVGPLLARSGWLILPVVAAGVGHVAVLRLGLFKRLAIPIDHGISLRGTPFFGANKTWRGLLLMTILTAVAVRTQAALARRNGTLLTLTPPCPSRLHPWMAGAALGLAYSLAELPNSFVKRRLGIEPGERSTRLVWLHYLMDQADSPAGCLLVLRLLYRLQRGELLMVFTLGTAIHVAIDAMLYPLGVKRRRA